ncbi:MAG: carboxypeptidase-like regulatory domain-containing protein [candidate division KSB1 bacterium]|nr:carboxypeptidase-like regulatory domain-containing protein [candidate division KSB1 bacterium]
MSKDTVVSVDLEHALVRINLNARSEYAVVDLSLTPQDASIVLRHENGETFTATGSHTFTQLPPGTFKYRITHSHYEPRTGKFSVPAGQRIKGRISMLPVDAKNAKLKSKKWYWWALGAAAIGGGTYYYINHVRKNESSAVLRIDMPDQVGN